MTTEKFKTYGEAIAYMKGVGEGFITEGPQLNCDDEGQWTYDVTVTDVPYQLVSELKDGIVDDLIVKLPEPVPEEYPE